MLKQLGYYLCLSCRKVFIFDDDVEDHRKLTGHEAFYSEQFDSVFNAKVAKEVQLLVHQAIIASLHSLGERPMNAIIWYLNNKGVLIDSNNINIKSFYSALEEILGPTADSVIEGITKQLCIHYKIDSGLQCSDTDNEHGHPLDQLQQVIDLILKHREA